MSGHLAHPDWLALAAAVRANPADDLPRLVAADWLEEHGQAERAEFIRVQCRLADASPESNGWPDGGADAAARIRELWPAVAGRFVLVPGCVPLIDAADHPGPGPVSCLVRRGFVERVSGPLAVLFGDVCQRCRGARDLYYVDPDAAEGTPCPACSGTGTRPGVGPAVVAAHPVGRVEVTNRVPSIHEDGGRFGWWGGVLVPDYDSDQLPRPIWDLVMGQPGCLTGGGYALFDTTEDATAALSTALIAWALAQPAPVPGVRP
jgi:uncharacterized protein (TIGR02996 family)